ncbi:MAG TPA: UDP-N-acetylmuramate--L-alanine ligase [Thermoanaerobaculia bacterium]|nr:UDP-N-acetylmuramate--L-alanine ligase [Thermoanaerobaculia bacterium]
MFQRFGLSRLHFVGIGGTGMSGIAEVLTRESGVEISGCDAALGEATERLSRLGVEVHEGHAADHLDDVDVLVISSAVPEDNVEVVAARRRGIPVVRRAEMLAELMRLKYGIAIAGTHGKTTTTSMVGAVVTEAGLDPTVIVGGRMRALGTGARVGGGDFLVAEADEFDRSFLRLAPVLATITNIDADHLDTYGDLDAIEDAFVEFANRVPFFGRVLVCLDDPVVQRVLPRLERRVETYGLSAQADLAAVDVEQRPGSSRFSVRTDDGVLGTVELPMPGLHNVRNALAAVGLGLAMNIPFATIAAALAGFGGVHRRFERLGTWRGATVVDDYAHHPTEVAATLEAARQAYPGTRVHAVFQPHLYSRTERLAAEFAAALLAADTALVTEIYRSREQPIEGVSGAMVVDEARSRGHRNALFCADWKAVTEALEERVGEGDLVLTLGAGDVYKLGLELVQSADGEEEKA